jgi:hypothetical protein
MTRQRFCFVVMPFKPDLNFFYLYLKRHLEEEHGLRVERGDHQILTRPLMDKIRARISEADVILGEISGANPNVFYELGLANAFEKPVIFLTQEAPEKAPVDVRQFEYIHYDPSRHEELLKKLDNAFHNVFVERYRELYTEASEVLRAFNRDMGAAYPMASLAEFQARIIRGELSQDVPAKENRARFAEFLLPKILREATEANIMRQVDKWLETQTLEVPEAGDRK